jgi:hypothetical protein
VTGAAAQEVPGDEPPNYRNNQERGAATRW